MLSPARSPARSPVLCPEDKNYTSALEEYEYLSTDVANRFETLGEADVNFKNLLDSLEELGLLNESLVREAEWDPEVMDSLYNTTRNIRKNIEDQDKALESVDFSISKATRGLAKLAKAVATVRMHAEDVRRAFDKRLNIMKRSSRSPGSKEHAKELPKEPKQPRADKDAAKEAAKEMERGRRRNEQEQTGRTELERLHRKEKERVRTRSQERPRTARA